MNIVHPHPVSWNDIFTHAATSSLSLLGLPVELEPYVAWLSKLEQLTTVPTEHDLRSVPGLKILRFLNNLEKRSTNGVSNPLQFSTSNTKTSSTTFRNAPQLDAQQVMNWFSYWQKIGYVG
ncbi:hypothetical protein QCA50_002725 [Cerrena zonata]|uniref:Uncharacterized protein n=1 Tax=Cerrena zonata TaxID=2478898 RepID=A0AAW0GUN6_9APHY